jgi:hypothetical protein
MNIREQYPVEKTMEMKVTLTWYSVLYHYQNATGLKSNRSAKIKISDLHELVLNPITPHEARVAFLGTIVDGVPDHIVDYIINIYKEQFSTSPFLIPAIKDCFKPFDKEKHDADEFRYKNIPEKSV